MPYFAESTIAEGIQWVNYQTPYCLKNLMKKEDLNHRQRYVRRYSRQGANIFVTQFILDLRETSTTTWKVSAFLKFTLTTKQPEKYFIIRRQTFTTSPIRRCGAEHVTL